MKLILCVSDEMGVLFNERRQSSDIKVVQDVIELASGSRVLAHTYSGKLFAEYPQVVLADDYLTQAGEDDYCFCEKGTPDANQVKSVILYLWNRSYPWDVCRDDVIEMNQFQKTEETEFSGNSHEKITRQIFERIS